MMPGRPTVRDATGYKGSVRWKGRLPVPAVRDAGEIAGVLAEPGCDCSGPVYYMYRDVARSPSDRQWLHDQEIRFDITVIPPRNLCGEWMKTKGHYHPESPSGTGYPEIYEVLEGEAHYLIQTRDCTDVAMIAATAGDIVVVPPGFGHVTINPSRTAVLQMANLVSSSFQSDYLPYENLRGAIFYEMTNGIFVKNPRYPQEPRLRLVKAGHIAAMKETVTDPLYDLVEQRAPVLGFLNHPEEYRALFSGTYP
jgi:glucose-6-phosphate isomerase, archaeal